MIKNFLRNRKGVTLLEGLIALLLLAVVATGTFGVLLSTSRKSSTPDLREEMALALEQALYQLQVYVMAENTSQRPDEIKNGLCPDTPDSDPLSSGTHHIECLLPPICDKGNSSFSYIVDSNNLPNPLADIPSNEKETVNKSFQSLTFDITCNGFSL